MKITDSAALERANRLAELQERLDEAEAVAPLRGIGRFVVGSWLAAAAHYLWIGGVRPGTLDAVLLGILAIGGWTFLLSGAVKFAKARFGLRRIRAELAAFLGATEGESDRLLPANEPPTSRSPS